MFVACENIITAPEERESNFPMEDDSDGSEDEFPFHAEDFHHRHRSGPEEWSLLSESRYRTRWNVLLLLITLDLLSSCVLLVIALERRVGMLVFQTKNVL